MDSNFIQALIMAFREGLEAFLIVTIMLSFLEKIDRKDLKKYVWNGVFTGLSISIVFGFLLFKLNEKLGMLKTTAKLWEAISSLIAVLLVSTFIFWMIKNGAKIKKHIEEKTALNLSKKGVFALIVLMIAREGVEVAIFSFAGKYKLLPIVVGVLLAASVVVLIKYSIIKVDLGLIFKITLVYLIIQG